MDSALIVAAWAFVAVASVVALLAANVFAAAAYYQGLLKPGLERDLGFTEGAAYLWVAGRTHSAVAVESVTPGGVFDSAGLRAGDVVPGLSHTDLFRYLHRHRGRVAELAVVAGGPGRPFHERPRRVLSVRVPAAKGSS